MNIATKVISNFKAGSQTWDNKDGYVQPMMSFRGFGIAVVVIVAVLVLAAMAG